MKNLIRKSLLVALVLGTLTSYANGTTLKKGTTTLAKVELNDVKRGQLWLIKNSDGVIIHEQVIKNSGSYILAIDFSSLENGNYSLEINKDFQIEVLPLTIDGGNPVFKDEDSEIVFKPLIRTEKNLVLISKLEFNNTPMKVAIYYENEIIFNDNVEGSDDVLKRVYSLNKNIKGSYTVILNANDRTYINEFSLK